LHTVYLVLFTRCACTLRRQLFLANCPADPYGCNSGGSPTPPPGSDPPNKVLPGDEDIDDWAMYTLLVVFLGGGLYVGGFTYMNIKSGMRGVSALPHRSFWSDRPDT
jgi:hypothetical protein